MFFFKITLRTQKKPLPRACVYYLCVRVCAYVSTLHVQTVDCCRGTCCPLETLYINLHNNINVCSLFPLPTYGSADLILLLLLLLSTCTTGVSHLSIVEWWQFLKAQRIVVQGRMMQVDEWYGFTLEGRTDQITTEEEFQNLTDKRIDSDKVTILTTYNTSCKV